MTYNVFSGTLNPTQSIRMEWRPAGWSVCLPLLIFPCTIKSRSSFLAPAHPDGLGKRAVKRLWWWW